MLVREAAEKLVVIVSMRAARKPPQTVRTDRGLVIRARVALEAVGVVLCGALGCHVCTLGRISYYCTRMHC